MSSESPEFGISPDFIEENKRINLVRPGKKFAPFTKAERQKRRKEVYRLHFEKGISALSIAEMMKVDKNTIYEDIRVLYKELGKPDSIEFSDYYSKQTMRLELQRSRLVEYLDNTQEIEKKIAIERLIADIDFRLLTMAEKVEHNSIAFWDSVKKMFNQVAEEKKLNYRITTVLELVKISAKSRKKLDDLVKEVISG